MKRFNQIADGIFRTLLEAPPPPVAPAAPANAPAAPAAGLPQDGGPVNVQQPAQSTQADRSPGELQNWETQIITMAADAIVRVQADPSLLTADDIKMLSSGVNLKNKDEVLDIIKNLGGMV